LATAPERQVQPSTAAVPVGLWNDRSIEPDDDLHNPDPRRDAKLDRSFTFFSGRGWMNGAVLGFIVVGLLVLFAGGPIISNYMHTPLATTGFNLGELQLELVEPLSSNKRFF
jgi:hypothetical protein